MKEKKKIKTAKICFRIASLNLTETRAVPRASEPCEGSREGDHRGINSSGGARGGGLFGAGGAESGVMWGTHTPPTTTRGPGDWGTGIVNLYPLMEPPSRSRKL